MKEWLTHPWLTVRVQIGLGAIFVAAALPKITDPPSFAQMIYNYRILPAGLINISALVLPWIELVTGLCLILGIWTRPARWAIGGMLVVFMVAITFNLLRGHAVDCGCFAVTGPPLTYDEKIYEMWIVLLRDAGMLLMLGQLWWAERHTRVELGTQPIPLTEAHERA